MAKLVSDWIVIGTSGPTVDGREISAQALKDAAKNYSKKTYTAVINMDHWYGNFGTVDGLRESKDEKGRVTLEAQIVPNGNFINNQKNYENKKFFSMELAKNFAGTGEAYLTGLAITDEPASLGIQEFSKAKNNEFFVTQKIEKINFKKEENSFLKNWFNNNKKERNEEETMSEKTTLEMFDASLQRGKDLIDKLSDTAEKKDLEVQKLSADLAVVTKAKKELEEKFAVKETEWEKEKNDLNKKIEEFERTPTGKTEVPNADGAEEIIIC